MASETLHFGPVLNLCIPNDFIVILAIRISAISFKRTTQRVEREIKQEVGPLH